LDFLAQKIEISKKKNGKKAGRIMISNQTG